MDSLICRCLTPTTSAWKPSLSNPGHRKELAGALRRSIQRRDLIFEAVADIPAADSEAANTRLDGESPADISQIAVGRGGPSVGIEQRIVPGSSVGFSLALANQADDETPISLNGWGVVRWCELVSEHVRAGIELIHLKDKSRESFASLATKRAALQLHPEGVSWEVVCRFTVNTFA